MRNYFLKVMITSLTIFIAHIAYATFDITNALTVNVNGFPANVPVDLRFTLNGNWTSGGDSNTCTTQTGLVLRNVSNQSYSSICHDIFESDPVGKGVNYGKIYVSASIAGGDWQPIGQINMEVYNSTALPDANFTPVVFNTNMDSPIPNNVNYALTGCSYTYDNIDPFAIFVTCNINYPPVAVSHARSVPVRINLINTTHDPNFNNVDIAITDPGPLPMQVWPTCVDEGEFPIVNQSKSFQPICVFNATCGQSYTFTVSDPNNHNPAGQPAPEPPYPQMNFYYTMQQSTSDCPQIFNLSATASSSQSPLAIYGINCLMQTEYNAPFQDVKCQIYKKTSLSSAAQRLQKKVFMR